MQTNPEIVKPQPMRPMLGCFTGVVWIRKVCSDQCVLLHQTCWEVEMLSPFRSAAGESDVPTHFIPMQVRCSVHL